MFSPGVGAKKRDSYAHTCSFRIRYVFDSYFVRITYNRVLFKVVFGEDKCILLSGERATRECWYKFFYVLQKITEIRTTISVTKRPQNVLVRKKDR